MIETDKEAILKIVKEDLDKKLGATLTSAGEEINLINLIEFDIYSN